jgi:phosphoribosylanthranilate isomerase
MKLKVCGIKDPENIKQLIDIQLDYIGFIFYPKSKRYVVNSLQSEIVRAIPSSINKVGVFVNESFDKIETRTKDYQLDFIQLHGDESAEFCKQLSEKGFQIIKAFQIHKDFNFNKLDAYKAYCKYFLFDTQTSLYGGSGHKFDWQLLENYDNEKSFFLSGGIDLDDADKILNIKNLNIHSIDINSKFEIEPGLKNIEKVKKFKEQLLHKDTQKTTEIHRKK